MNSKANDLERSEGSDVISNNGVKQRREWLFLEARQAKPAIGCGSEVTSLERAS